MHKLHQTAGSHGQNKGKGAAHSPSVFALFGSANRRHGQVKVPVLFKLAIVAMRTSCACGGCSRAAAKISALCLVPSATGTPSRRNKKLAQAFAYSLY